MCINPREFVHNRPWSSGDVTSELYEDTQDILVTETVYETLSKGLGRTDQILSEISRKWWYKRSLPKDDTDEETGLSRSFRRNSGRRPVSYVVGYK